MTIRQLYESSSAEESGPLPPRSLSSSPPVVDSNIDETFARRNLLVDDMTPSDDDEHWTRLASQEDHPQLSTPGTKHTASAHCFRSRSRSRDRGDENVDERPERRLHRTNAQPARPAGIRLQTWEEEDVARHKRLTLPWMRFEESRALQGEQHSAEPLQSDRVQRHDVVRRRSRLQTRAALA